VKNLKEIDPRVLHLISSSGFLGAENVVLELAKETTKAGFWVTIGILENRNNIHMELAERAKGEGLKVQIFPCRGRFDRGTISSIRSFINEEKPNLFHSHGYKSNFYSLFANRGKLPWIVTNHLWKRTTYALKVYAYIDSLLMRKADKVIAVSEEIADEMTKKGIPSTKILVIDNGIDLQKFENKTRNNDLRKSFGLNGNHKIIGTIASLTEEKGHRYLIEAAKHVIDKCPECRFLIVGDGGQRHFLEKTVAGLGLTEKVIFTGSRKDVPDILSMLDLFVLPSLKEGLPMALLEAMASKVPVIATSVGAIPKVIVNNKTGILVDPGNANVLSTAILALLHNGQTAYRLASTGFQKVKTEYSAQMMSSRYVNLYRNILLL
jgi:glycosyltransferase involved in cell wall biosynthesis